MPLCDLHVHSNCSDGSCTPEELIAVACNAGVGAVALTDHNTVSGLSRFEAAATGTDVIAIPGVEVTAGIRIDGGSEKEVHILGLFISAKVRETLATFLTIIDRRKVESNRTLIRRLAEAGYAIDPAAVQAVAGEATPNRVHVARVLMAGGYVQSIEEAFHTLIRDGGPYYLAPARLDALEVIDFLHSLDILPVLAHPTLTLSREEISAFLPVAREHGLVGVETIYPLYSEDETVFMADLAEQCGLLPSGGSDFHGTAKPDTHMGVGRNNIATPMAVYEHLRERSGYA